MESESGTSNTKISDSGYANSCSNSHSQRSASSKSQHSGSNSSRSSGYCLRDINIKESTDLSKRTKDKELKKKKVKSAVLSNIITFLPESIQPPILQEKGANTTSMGINTTPINIDTVQQSDKLENIVDSGTHYDSNGVVPVVNNTADHNTDLSSKNITQEFHNNNQDVIEEKIYDIQDSKPENGFCCVVSMNDGVILYTTASLTKILGFPKDMWLGRSFIDFVHPKDRDTFSSQVTSGVAIPLVKCHDAKSSCFVCLRKYRGLKSSGFAVVEKLVSYQAFQLTVTFKSLMDTSDNKVLDRSNNIFLVVFAAPVYSPFKEPYEKRKSNKFGMRHTSSCTFSHVDVDVVTNFGFLPQDIVGKSVFDFYHPADMPFLKEVYETVMRMRQITGSVFKSKPYRFAVQNGGFAVIETEWSSFINPWSRRLEFVVGLHRVLQGPKNPDIFALPNDEETKFISEDTIRESKIIQGEILLLLNKEISPPNETAKQEVSKRCKDLANFMESLMDEVKSNLELVLPQDTDPTISVSYRKKERDSVMLGEISPHHDYCDSKSSSETPPSYNQLNYNENIKRFFQSRPKTTVSSDVSDEKPISQSNPVIDTDLEGKISTSEQTGSNNQKCISPVENSGTSGSGSAGILSIESIANLESRTTSAISNDSYKTPHLTEEILLQHNEVMEQLMIKKHKEIRLSTKENKKNYHKNEKLNHMEKLNIENIENVVQSQGVKRSGSHSWEDDGHKVSKHRHQTGQICHDEEKLKQNSVNQNDIQLNIPSYSHQDSFRHQVGTNDSNLWPPFSVTITPITNTQTSNVANSGVGGFTTGMFPVYYIPTRHQGEYLDNNLNNSQPYQIQYIPGMIYNYNPIFSSSSIMCSPLSIVPMPVPAITTMAQENESNRLNVPISENVDIKPNASVISTPKFQRPASQATSVKAEPGSALGSIASASLANKALSECSRNNLGLQSVCSPGSPIVSPPECEGVLENNSKKDVYNKDKNNSSFKDSGTIDEESSYYSSSYSSFFKTDVGSGSNDDYITMDVKNATSDDNSWKIRPPSIKKSDPPWLKAVSITPDLIYRYQMAVKDLEEILEADLKTLKETNQPNMVNDQLNQLYVEMELDSLSQRLSLEDCLTSSSSSDENYLSSSNINQLKKKRRSYSSLVMIYEENAPLPPPDS